MEIKPDIKMTRTLPDSVPRQGQGSPIRPVQTPLTTATEMHPKVQESPLRPGQNLLATVTDMLPKGRAILDIAGRSVEVRSPIPLVVGQQLKLISELSGDGLRLRILDFTASSHQTRELLASAMQNAQAKQADLLPFIRSLLEAAQPPALPKLGKPALPLEVQWPKAFNEFARQVVSALPNREQIVTPEGLKAAIARSGLFLEAQLARGQAPQPGGDMKADLVRVAALIKAIAENPLLPVNPAIAAALAVRPQSTPPPRDVGAPGRLAEAAISILRQTEGALGRTRVAQFQTVERSTREDPDWVLEVPVRGSEKELESLRLRIRRDTGGGKPGQRDAGWSVTITHEDEVNGTVHMVVGLTSEKVSVTFWAERDKTATLFSDKLDVLNRRLREAGLDVEHLMSRHGKPPSESGKDSPPPAEGLLDVQA